MEFEKLKQKKVYMKTMIESMKNLVDDGERLMRESARRELVESELIECVVLTAGCDDIQTYMSTSVEWERKPLGHLKIVIPVDVIADDSDAATTVSKALHDTIEYLKDRGMPKHDYKTRIKRAVQAVIDSDKEPIPF